MPSPGKSPYDRSPEALEVGASVCAAKCIAIYKRPTLDALLAVWICQRIRTRAGLQPGHVLFLPPAANAVGPEVFAVGAGHGKGVKRFGLGKAIERSALGGSAAMACYRALPEDDRLALEDFVAAISDAEESGQTVHEINLRNSKYPDGSPYWDNILLRGEVLSTTIWAVFDNLRDIVDDLSMLATWTNVFDGILSTSKRQNEAVHAAANANYFLGGLLAILPHNSPAPMTARQAFQRGAKVALFSSMLGFNRWTLGLIRKPGEDQFINLNDDADRMWLHLPDLTIHPKGHWAGWTASEPLQCSEADFRERHRALASAAIEVVRRAVEKKG